MTPDLDAIRAALTANAEGDCAQAETAYNNLVANAPVWLASLCALVEQQQAQLDSQARSITKRAAIRRLILKERKEWKHAAKLERERHLNWEARWEEVRAERDAALAECKRLRNVIQQVEDPWFVDNTIKERDAALAECERLTAASDVLVADITQGMSNLWRMAYDSGYQAGHNDGYTKGRFYPERL